MNTSLAEYEYLLTLPKIRINKKAYAMTTAQPCHVTGCHPNPNRLFLNQIFFSIVLFFESSSHPPEYYQNEYY